MTMLTGLLTALEILVPHQPTCAIADVLNLEIRRLTSYTVTNDCPEVRRIQFKATKGSFEQAAAFFPDTGEIGLAPDLDLDTIVGRSYLLHEMVHAAQYADGAQDRVACHDTLEAEAYWVQSVYLRQNGEHRLATNVLLVASFLGNCTEGRYAAN